MRRCTLSSSIRLVRRQDRPATLPHLLPRYCFHADCFPNPSAETVPADAHANAMPKIPSHAAAVQASRARRVRYSDPTSGVAPRLANGESDGDHALVRCTFSMRLELRSPYRNDDGGTCSKAVTAKKNPG
jgi:hypothetical protein